MLKLELKQIFKSNFTSNDFPSQNITLVLKGKVDEESDISNLVHKKYIECFSFYNR